MAIDVTELEQMRDDLVRARARGVRVLQLNGERVEYKTDAEMSAAIGDLNRQIAAAKQRPLPAARFVGFSRGDR
jgi:hypothetical protein